MHLNRDKIIKLAKHPNERIKSNPCDYHDKFMLHIPAKHQNSDRSLTIQLISNQ